MHKYLLDKKDAIAKIWKDSDGSVKVPSEFSELFLKFGGPAERGNGEVSQRELFRSEGPARGKEKNATLIGWRSANSDEKREPGQVTLPTSTLSEPF